MKFFTDTSYVGTPPAVLTPVLPLLGDPDSVAAAGDGEWLFGPAEGAAPFEHALATSASTAATTSSTQGCRWCAVLGRRVPVWAR
ncbi:MAG TPA: hypothetical protein VFJ09_06895 [Nocardioidaceae bacterium]|nr:hypothetical protein [Nocardioidaceae bacterium]